MIEIAKEIAPYIIALLSALVAYVKIQTERAKTAKSRDEGHESNVVRLEKIEWTLQKHDEEIREAKASQDDLKMTLDAMNATLISIKTTVDLFVTNKLRKEEK